MTPDTDASTAGAVNPGKVGPLGSVDLLFFLSFFSYLDLETTCLFFWILIEINLDFSYEFIDQRIKLIIWLQFLKF